MRTCSGESGAAATTGSSPALIPASSGRPGAGRRPVVPVVHGAAGPAFLRRLRQDGAGRAVHGRVARLDPDRGAHCVRRRLLLRAGRRGRTGPAPAADVPSTDRRRDPADALPGVAARSRRGIPLRSTALLEVGLAARSDRRRHRDPDGIPAADALPCQRGRPAADARSSQPDRAVGHRLRTSGAAVRLLILSQWSDANDSDRNVQLDQGTLRGDAASSRGVGVM